MSRYDVNVLLYRLKKDRAFRERFRTDPAGAGSSARRRHAPPRSGRHRAARRRDELGGSLHLVLSIPGMEAH
jgi:hypothetical protein